MPLVKQSFQNFLRELLILKKSSFTKKFSKTSMGINELNLIVKSADDENLFKAVLFTDECTFQNNEIVNRHSFHDCSVANFHQFRIIHIQHTWLGNVWGQYLIGPSKNFWMECFFLEFLRNDIPVLLQDIRSDIAVSNGWKCTFSSWGQLIF